MAGHKLGVVDGVIDNVGESYMETARKTFFGGGGASIRFTTVSVRGDAGQALALENVWCGRHVAPQIVAGRRMKLLLAKYPAGIMAFAAIDEHDAVFEDIRDVYDAQVTPNIRGAALVVGGGLLPGVPLVANAPDKIFGWVFVGVAALGALLFMAARSLPTREAMESLLAAQMPDHAAGDAGGARAD